MQFQWVQILYTVLKKEDFDPGHNTDTTLTRHLWHNGFIGNGHSDQDSRLFVFHMVLILLFPLQL